MAQTNRSKSRTRRDPRDSFDVTAVIGTVQLDPHSAMSAHVAAFSMIAEHDTPGEYTFPLVDGQTCHVTVEYRDAGIPAKVGDPEAI